MSKSKRFIKSLLLSLTVEFACVIVLLMLWSWNSMRTLWKINGYLSLFLLAVPLIFFTAACTRHADSPVSDPPLTPTDLIIEHTPTPTTSPTPIPSPTPEPSSRLSLAEHALFIGDWDSALSEFTTAQELSSDVEVVSASQLGIGKTYYFMGNYYEAIQTLESLIVNFPNSSNLATAYFYLAQAHSALEQHDNAAHAYLQYMELQPGLIDAYVSNLRADSLLAVGNYAEAAVEYQNAQSSGSLLNGEWLSLKNARALAFSGDYLTAINLYDEILNTTSDNATKALIGLRKGQVYTMLGEYGLAIESYNNSVTNFPAYYDSYSALVELVEADIPVDELQRGIIDYYAGQYGVALAAFDRYLQNEPADPGTAYYFSGLSNRALGGHTAAIEQWDKVIANYSEHSYWDEAWEQKAYTQWAFLDQHAEAVESLLQFVSLAPVHERAGEFLYDAAYVSEVAGELDQAAQYWEQTNSQYPGYEKADRALFLAGITQYRLGNFTKSLALFQSLALEASAIADRAAAHLWIGKVKQSMGDDIGADQSWEKAAGIDPTGYYSERARDLIRDREPFEPPVVYDLAFDREKEQIQAEDWIRTTFALPPDTVLNSPSQLVDRQEIVRANELWKVGLFSEARNELELLRQSVTNDPVLSYQLMNYLLDMGLYRSAILTSRQILDLAGMDDATTFAAPAYFNHVRFGPYYSELVMENAQEYNFHPLFLFSLIRQESLFESFIQSSAAASGLMQIIPATGDQIYKNIGWPQDYTTDDLYRPIVNIRYGTDYLDTQRNIFSGDLYTALAAYNGGPGNASEWKREAPNDSDLFLEIIRFSETRDYIKRIYEIYTIYNRLYDRTP